MIHICNHCLISLTVCNFVPLTVAIHRSGGWDASIKRHQRCLSHSCTPPSAFTSVDLECNAPRKRLGLNLLSSGWRHQPPFVLSHSPLTRSPPRLLIDSQPLPSASSTQLVPRGPSNIFPRLTPVLDSASITPPRPPSFPSARQSEHNVSSGPFAKVHD